MLFKFMFRVSLVKMCYLKWVKCRICVCDNMFLDVKEGCAIVRGVCYNLRGAIFGGYTVFCIIPKEPMHHDREKYTNAG